VGTSAPAPVAAAPPILDRLAAAVGRVRWSGPGHAEATAAQVDTPTPGTRLTREYQGQLYEVGVRRDGIGYGGVIYGSLSEVARLITGTRWNGPRFFGLRGHAGDD
jgi:hypothetical protein